MGIDVLHRPAIPCIFSKIREGQINALADFLEGHGHFVTRLQSRKISIRRNRNFLPIDQHFGNLIPCCRGNDHHTAALGYSCASCAAYRHCGFSRRRAPSRTWLHHRRIFLFDCIREVAGLTVLITFLHGVSDDVGVLRDLNGPRVLFAGLIV